jgi:3-hydroxyisobutyrate dehydrogenase
MKVGFIGIGAMGRHMSGHVLEAGYDLTVHDLRKEAAAGVLAKGAKWAKTPKEIAENCEVVLTSLPGPPEVEAVVYGANGLSAGWKRGDIYVDMSTNSPTTVRKVAEVAKTKGVAVLDAPVSGGTRGAESKRLTIMVGGDATTLEKVHEILAAIGDKIFYVGDIGCGNIAKLVNNFIGLTCGAINAEGFVLGAKAGIDIRKLREIVRVSTGNNYNLESSMPQIFQGNFEPGFRVSLGLKDLGLALALAKECGVPTPVGAAVEQRYLEAKAAGLGDKGTQSIILRLEELAGIKVRAPEDK